MNLHIVPDSRFINSFHSNLVELGILENNRIVVRSAKKLRYVDAELPYAPLYSARFRALVGDTMQYDAVFIHLFSPLMYRWVAGNSFRKLNWMVWGADLYNLPFIDFNAYEKKTYEEYPVGKRSLNEWLYLLKVWTTGMPFRNRAYAKVDNVLTWMNSEYGFAKAHITRLRAGHRFFFYENQVPYQKLDDRLKDKQPRKNGLPDIIVGNSGYPTNNHLDAVEYLNRNDIKANLLIPVSYGNSHYIRFLRKSLGSYVNGRVTFVDKHMSFDDYVEFLSRADALIMNNVRPQGYGNVLMMLYMKKPVFLNDKNISIPDLLANGILPSPWTDLHSLPHARSPEGNRQAIINLLSHERLQQVYYDLFA